MTKTNFPNGIIAPFSVAGTAVPSLTDNSGGTAADTIAVIGAAYNQVQRQPKLMCRRVPAMKLNRETYKWRLQQP